jgi:dTDP-3-amino-2,3,6-trideoxy-4-keto-D-glucose/dTDP-3-amino-3,4,6-trideoxy-alpha-D-glucose/dTDP-2,6-dideoxy-D-kanosamine transaminase
MSLVPMFNLKPVTDVANLSRIAKNVLESSQHILGENVSFFEQKFAEYIGTKYCTGVANGSDALVIALRAIGIKKEDQVATVANAGFYTSAALNIIGADPIFIDVDEDSLLIEPNDLKLKISENNVKAVVVTHLYGQVAPILEISQICKSKGIPLLEDCAQAHGAEVSGRKVGSFGDISTFSFYPTKNLGAVGDGGAILTSNHEFAERIISLRQYGWSEKYNVSVENGSNSRLDEIQAAFLIEKMVHLDTWNKQRVEIARTYVEAFNNLDLKTLQKTLSGVAHLFVIQTNIREKLMDHLSKKLVQHAIHYPIPDHRQNIFKDKFKNIHLPVTEISVKKILSLPIYPGMKDSEVDQVISSVISFKD